MNPSLSHPLTDDEIHTLVDGQAAPGQLAALRARLALDADAQATVLQWQRQRDALRGLLHQVEQEPVPASLLSAGQGATDSQQAVRRWSRWGGLAASALLVFGAGWLSHGQWDMTHPSSSTPLSKAAHGREFIHQAALAHAVYAPEVRHPVEVTAAQQEHLVQWLSKRLGKPLKVPQLSGQGFDLVGGRLLPGDAGARAQFMFQNAGGQRVTLYLGVMDASPPSAALSETAFRFSNEGPVPSFYWVDQGWGYALSGALTREDLLAIAEAVFRQL